MPFSLYGGTGFYLSVSIMKKLSTILSLPAVLLLPIVNGSTSLAQTHEVLITTNMGNMRVMLYDDCPRTVNNFLKNSVRLSKQTQHDATILIIPISP